MKRAWLFAGIAASAFALVFSCSSIPEPAARVLDGSVPEDAADATDDAPTDVARCRGHGEYRYLHGNGEIIAGDDPKKTLLVATGVFDEPDAGRVIYELLVTGAPADLVGKPPVDLASARNADLATCQYCGLAMGDCTQISSDTISCDSAYQAVTGQARTIRFPTEEGGTYWVDVANVVLVKVLARDGFEITDAEPSDCIALDRLTLQGPVVAVTRPCTPAYQSSCAIADTASKR